MTNFKNLRVNKVIQLLYLKKLESPVFKIHYYISFASLYVFLKINITIKIVTTA